MYEPHTRPSDVSVNEMRHDRIVLFPDRSQIVMLLVMAVVGGDASLLAPSFIETRVAAVRYLLWTLAPFFTAMALQILWRLLRPRPTLVADATGIADYSFSGAPVFLRWQDVGDIAVEQTDVPRSRSNATGGVWQRFLVVRPRPDASVAVELTAAQRAVRRLKSGGMIFDGLRVQQNLLPVEVEELRDRLIAVWSQHGGPGARRAD